MIDTRFKKPGKLVKFRGRRCVVQPSTDLDIINLKPLGGSDDEIISVFEPILQHFEKIEDDQYKDSTTILQLLKENIDMWSVDLAQEQVDEEVNEL